MALTTFKCNYLTPLRFKGPRETMRAISAVAELLVYSHRKQDIVTGRCTYLV